MRIVGPFKGKITKGKRQKAKGNGQKAMLVNALQKIFC